MGVLGVLTLGVSLAATDDQCPSGVPCKSAYLASPARIAALKKDIQPQEQGKGSHTAPDFCLPRMSPHLFIPLMIKHSFFVD